MTLLYERLDLIWASTMETAIQNLWPHLYSFSHPAFVTGVFYTILYSISSLLLAFCLDYDTLTFHKRILMLPEYEVARLRDRMNQMNQRKMVS